jgi:bifunctional non-homologous end joining protein LigD
MRDLFDDKIIKPMLIAEQKEPFDSPDHIFEIKYDDHRVIAYLGDSTDIRNKKDVSMIHRYPELENLHEQVFCKCILDGELVVFKNGISDFNEIQRRALMTNKFKNQMQSNKLPATFVA